MARHCLSHCHPAKHMNCHPLMPCSTTCRTHRPMSSVTVGMLRTNSVNLSGTGDLVLSFRQGRLIRKSPVPNGLTDTGIWSKTCGQDSRSGGLSQPDMRRPLHLSSPSSSSLLQQTTSSPRGFFEPYTSIPHLYFLNNFRTDHYYLHVFKCGLINFSQNCLNPKTLS